MKYKKNKSGMPEAVVEEKDFDDIQEIKKTIESKGWQVLTRCFQNMRLLIENEGKVHCETETGREKCSVDFAKLKGFDHFLATPQLAITQLEVLRDARKKQEEIKNATKRDDY